MPASLDLHMPGMPSEEYVCIVRSSYMYPQKLVKGLEAIIIPDPGTVSQNTDSASQVPCSDAGSVTERLILASQSWTFFTFAQICSSPGP